MRIKLVAFLGVCFVILFPPPSIGGSGDALAQSSDITGEATVAPGQAAESSSGKRLDELLDQLGSEPKKAGARRIARQVWQIWSESGSDTINLLMGWTAEAIQKKDFATAGDLLDHVITLKPDYVEGWNRRATVYFLQSDFGRSLSDIERTLQLEPRHFGALAGLGAILQKTNQERQALKTWYRILEIYPANEQAQKAVIDLEEEFAGEGI